ncbi:MAG: hypothetical protein ABL995_20840 [Bryobacteraceae bacterium]
MLRRPFLKLLPYAAVFAGCTKAVKADVMEQLREMAKSRDLVLLTSRMDAFNLDMTSAGPLELWENSDSIQIPLAISPDGGTVVWFPLSSLPAPPTFRSRPIVAMWNGEQKTYLQYHGTYAQTLCVSSLGDRVFLLVRSTDIPNMRLVQISAHKGESVVDLSGFSPELDLSKAENLSTSGDGQRVAIGFRDYVVAKDLASGQALVQRPGRFPKLSPDGRRIAFVTPDQRMTVHDLDSGREQYFLESRTTYGVGGWSPDGRFIIAGSRPFARLTKRLTIVDSSTGAFVELYGLSEGDFGSRFAWIRRHLLSAEGKKSR